MTPMNFIDQTDRLAKQRGGILIESLIGLLILGLIGGGIMHSTARMTVAQRDMTVQGLAVSQMRGMLMTGKNATGGDVCTSAPSVQLPGSQTPANITVQGCALVPMTISGIKIDGVAGSSSETINAARPRVFEVGDGDELVRIGGKI
jgi:type II secretory pathway pseudopilin PulG